MNGDSDATGELPADFYAPPGWLVRELGPVGGRGVRIAVVDSGRDPDWQEPRIRPGVDLVAGGDDADRIGHGTACLDVLLRLAPEAELFPVRVFDTRLETSVGRLAQALEWAAANDVRLVNLSLGTLLEANLRPLYQACEAAHRRGVILISAVNHQTGWSYPAIFDNTLGVRAGRFTNAFDYLYQEGEAAEGIAHGGGRLRWLGGELRQLYASSFAAPHLTAMAALLLERHPAADLAELRRLLAGYARNARSGGEAFP